MAFVDLEKALFLEKVRKWKEGMEKKRVRVNAGKTQIMWCQVSLKGQVEDSGVHPCGVCRDRVSIIQSYVGLSIKYVMFQGGLRKYDSF